MALSDIVTVNITSTSVGVTQAGFGVPLLLSANAAWPTERVRFYTDVTGVAADFATTTPEYKAATAVFSQNPKVKRIAIGKLALKPTQRRTITPTAVNDAVYRVRVGSTIHSFTADASATAAEIVTGLIALINAGTDTLTATGTTTLVLTGNTPGAWDDVEILDRSLMSLEQDHADPGVATDLDAIKLYDNTWYAIYNPYNSRAMGLAIAAWTEANEKLFILDTQDTPVENVAVGSATDVAATAKTSAYFRTSVWYHPSTGSMFGAALLGNLLPDEPGSETWAFKTLAGVAAVSMSATQRLNVHNKYANTYQTEAGVNVTEGGKVAGNEWIDVIRLRDWTKARMQERVFALKVGNRKVPYTDFGANMIGGAVRSVLADGVKNKGYASYAVEVGKVADEAALDRQNRIYKGCKWSAVLAGAIHVTEINGTVSV